MKQLYLLPKDLVEIGFKEWITNNSCHFRIETINGFIYHNPLEPKYVWYLKIIIGETSNDIHLDINSLNDLINILKIFRIKHTDISLSL